MPTPKQPPRSTDDILREMETMSGSVGDAPASGKSGGALKSLLDFFIKIEPEDSGSAPAAVPSSPPPAMPGRHAVPPQSAPRRVGDLVAGEAAPKFKAPNTAANLAEQPFEAIYRDAGLDNSPCSVDELAKLLENPAVANQPLNVKVIAVNLALTAKGLAADVPIADAVRRDRALDAFQAMLDERARATEQRNSAQVQQIAQEVEELLKRKQAEMDALRSEISEVKRQSLEFAGRRETEERRLAALISPFLEGQPNPVTVGSAAVEAKETQPLPSGKTTTRA